MKKDLIQLPHRGEAKTQRITFDCGALVSVDVLQTAGTVRQRGQGDREHERSFATESSAVGVEGEPSLY